MTPSNLAFNENESLDFLCLTAVSVRYVIKIREFAKFVVGLGEKVSATDIEESMRVGVDTSHGGKCGAPDMPST